MRPQRRPPPQRHEPVRLYHRRRRQRRLRAGQSADRGSAATRCCCSRPAARTATSGSTSRSATASCSPTQGQLALRDRAGAAKPRPRHHPAARQGARRLLARSTGCSTSAASARTSTTGASSAMPAGASTTCCPISARPRISSAAQTNCTATAGRSCVSDMEPHADVRCLHRGGGAVRHPRNRGLQRRRAGRFRLLPADHAQGRRCSAAVGYLKPARRRANLRVVSGALATRVLFEGRRAVGVEYRAGRRDAHGARRRRGDPRGRRLQLAATAAALRRSARQRCCSGTASRSSPTCPASALTCRTTTMAASVYRCTQPVSVNDLLASSYAACWPG